jgi:hypothetical protein
LYFRDFANWRLPRSWGEVVPDESDNAVRHARKHIPHITQCDVKVKGVLEYPNPEIPSLCRPYPEETYIEYPITVMLE